MVDSNYDCSKPKLSPEFRARLSNFAPEQKVRAIIILETSKIAASSGRRQSREERQAALEAVRKSATAVLAQIDEALKPFDGRRLSASPGTLGSIVIETNVAGVLALAKSKYVKAILEDQPLSLHKENKRSQAGLPSADQ